MTSQAFWDKRAERYAAKPIANLDAYHAKLDHVRAHLRPGNRILEIGCGTGGTALSLAPAVSHVTATDGSRNMIRIARSKLAHNAPDNVTFDQADAADTIAGHPFDVICAFSLLHLVEDVPHVLNHIHQQLKPDGLLILKTECLKDRSIILRALVRLLTALSIAPKVTAFSRNELVSFLHDANFAIAENTYLGTSPTSRFIVARRQTP